MSIPSDPSQASSSSAASNSKPTGRSLSEILQTAPTGSAHPGVEEIRNIDPKEDQERVIAFTKEEPMGNRPLQSREGDKVQKLCRKLPNGTTSCIILGLETEKLFMTMQGQGYFCSLPAEPNQTHMECVKIPK